MKEIIKFIPDCTEHYLGFFKVKEDAYNAYYNKFLELYGTPPWDKI